MNAKTKNALIGGLLAIVFVMAVGYAAFAQQLTINGTATVTSNWQVELTNIEATSTNGTGTDVPYAASTAEDGTQLVNATTAQFKADLKSPGDSVTYTVTIENKGNINAKVTGISFTEGEDSAPISYTYEGIAENDVINANNTTKTFTVTVTYDASVEAQPDVTNNTLTMHINFGQASA